MKPLLQNFACAILTVAAIGCSNPSTPEYREGYAFGERQGVRGYERNDYSPSKATEFAASLGRKTSGREGCPYQRGTPEYGDYMAGVKAGYNSGYEN